MRPAKKHCDFLGTLFIGIFRSVVLRIRDVSEFLCLLLSLGESVGSDLLRN